MAATCAHVLWTPVEAFPGLAAKHEQTKRNPRPKTAHSARIVLEYAKERKNNVPIVELDNM